MPLIERSQKAGKNIHVDLRKVKGGKLMITHRKASSFKNSINTLKKPNYAKATSGERERAKMGSVELAPQGNLMGRL